MRTWLVGVVVIVVVIVVVNPASAQVDPCAPQQLSLRGIDVLPVDGTSDVPTNVTPFVTGADLELRLVGPDGNDIAATPQDMLVVGSFGAQSTLRRLVPAGDLSPGETITIIADGQIRSTFTVGGTADGEGPAAPDALVDGVLAGDTTACGPIQSSVTVGVAGEDAAFFVGVVNGEPTVGAGVRLDGASASDELVLFTEGAVEVNVASVDLAGNVSASVPINVEVPKGPPGLFSCASTSASASTSAFAMDVSAPVFASVLLAGAAMRRRRRARTQATRAT